MGSGAASVPCKPHLASLSILVFICRMRLRMRAVWACREGCMWHSKRNDLPSAWYVQMFNPWQVSSLLLCIRGPWGWQGCVLHSCHPEKFCLMPCTPDSCEANDGPNNGRKSSLLLSAFIEYQALCWALGIQWGEKDGHGSYLIELNNKKALKRKFSKHYSSLCV